MSQRYDTSKEDKWFHAKGVKPPEHIGHITEQEARELRKENLERHNCEWHQQGGLLVCDADEFTHGKRIDPKLRLVGTDDQGKPILKPHGPIYRDSLPDNDPHA